MGFGNVGIWEVVLILAVLLLVFGAKRLPEIGSALGKGIREFKGSVRDIESEFKRPADSRGDLPRSEAPRSESQQEAPRPESGQAPRTDDHPPRDTEAPRPDREPPTEA